MKRVLKKVLKWIGYTLLTLIVLTVTIVLFLLNSTKTIQWAADTYAPQYGFAYKQISGGLLTGLEVEELTFKNDKLLDHLKIGWNPAAILYKKISITHLDANGLDVDNIDKIIEAFTSTEPEEDNGSFVLPVTVGVGDLHLTVKPFEKNGIAFKTIALDGKNMLYYGKGVNIDDLVLSIQNNIATIQLNGRFKDKKVRIKKLSISDIDTNEFQDVIKKMIAIKIHKEIQEVAEPVIKRHKAGDKDLIPKSLLIDSAIVAVKPAEYPQIRLNQGELNITSLALDLHGMIDFEPDTVQVGDLSLLVDTNLSKLSMNSKLQDETITVESLSLQDIDTIALTKLFESIEYNQTANTEPKVSFEDKTIDTNSTVNPLLPKFLYVKQLDSSIKSVTYNPVFVKSAEVNATNVKVNIGTLTAESGEVDVASVTNFASLVQHGVIKDNHIETKGNFTAHKAHFETYRLLWKEHVADPIPLSIKADKKQAIVDFDIKVKEIFQAKEGEFNVTDFSLTNKLVYLIPEAKLTVESKGNISTSYTKDIRLKNVLTLKDGVLDYKGRVEPGKIEGIDANYTKLLNGLKITYHGDANGVKAVIDSEAVKGKLVSDDYKKGELTLATKEALYLKNMFSLPELIQPAKVAVDVHVPLDFSTITPLNAKAKIRSNLANVDADLLYDKELKVISKTIFPEDSLLRAFSPKLNLDAFSPLEADLTMVEKAMHVDVRSKGLTSKVKYNLENKDLDGNMVLGGAEFVFKGNVEKELSLENSVSSLENLLKQISTIYAFEVPPIDGDAKVSLVLTDMKDVELKLNSNTLSYGTDKKTKHILNNTMISLDFSDSNLTLNKYHTTFQEQKIYATKPSVITFKEGNVEISPLWINDELKVTGRYNIENKKGEILAFADAFKVSHEMTDLESRIDINTRLEGGSTDIKGTVTILGGNIYYDVDTKTFASDSDIINAEELKKKESSPFMDALIASIKVNTEQPLIYKTEEADIKINTDLLILKVPKGPVQVLGTVEILKGSSYSFKNKKFVLKKSIIAFTGDPNKPILDIAAVYKTVTSEINIQVKGSHTTPHIILSSIPYMSRHEILTVLLFDTQESAGDHSEDDMMKMGGMMAHSVLSTAGGAMTKRVLSDIGINIDNIPFLGGSSDANKTQKSIFSFFSNDEEEVVIPTHEIRFAGQKYLAEKDLQKAMGVDSKNIFQFWKEDKPSIDDKLLPTLEESLRNFYDSEGFYGARFSIKTSKTDVAVSITENKPVKIHDINIKSDYDISDLITFEKGKVFRAKEFVSVKNKIIQKLLKEGYCSYDLDSKAYVDLDTHEVSVLFALQKGGVCTFGKVTVHGLETIDDSVVLSRVRGREGERFSTERIKESYEALYDLEAFDSVLVNYDRKFYNVVPIDIVGAEVTKPWYLKFGAIYDTDVGVRLSTEVIRTNFMGNAEQIGLHLAYSSIEELAEVNYFVPALFNISDYYIDLTSKVGYREFRYSGFEEEKGYAQVLLTYADEKWSAYAGLAVENISISLFDDYAWVPSVGQGTFLLAGPFLGFTYDDRDSKLDPKYGYYIEGKVEYALPYDDEASSYLKYTLEGRAIHTFSDLTLSAVAKAGSVDQIQNEIPESKLFFAGGVYSNRAYGYKRVGVILSPTNYGIAGGSTMANLSLEANYPIWEDLYGAVFTDNTMLTNDKFDFSGDVLFTGGVGVRYKTPIGPLKVDIGMNVRDTSQYGIQFQIGQSF
ncbi:translocation/assembly module TamB domain-containing protein [Sulfurovum sp. CS9]|uniref:translocation/assembly module TamB domain-containing protein n=1 Tax=Sulfurovum sp. CS9 TaxID=3391146 RepID=UPI0039E91297